MHSQFADWYRLAAVDVKEVDLKARWAGVKAAAESFSAADILDAGRMIYDLPVRATDFPDRLRAHFKATDDKFPMQGNNVELRVLAGATLVAQFEFSDDWANVAALTIVCPSFRGARPCVVGDIERIAREALSARSAALRTPTDLRPPLSEKFIADLEQLVRDALVVIKANQAASATHDAMANVLRQIVTGFKSVDEWTRADLRQQTLRREESNVLWWLFGGFSRDLDVAFSAIKPPGVVIVAGKEMAELTGAIPGPYPARAFLDKAMRENLEKVSVTLADAISACPSEWRKTTAAHPQVPIVEDLCPSLFAIRKATEADGKKTWPKVFELVTAIKATQLIDAVDLAQQVFEEWLLARAVNELGKA